MSFRSVANHVPSILALFATTTLVCYAQVNRVSTNSASHVMAEMTNGRLNPAESKMGDTLVVTLREDVRSNGEIILKKGAAITGVIRSVMRAEANREWKGESETRSIIQIEWLIPPVQGSAAQSLSFALHSVSQAESAYEHTVSSDDTGFGGPSASLAARAVRNMGGLLDSPTNAVGVARTTTASIEPSGSTTVNGRSNVALLSMPSVVAADQQTRAAIESALGSSPSGELFRVGHSQLVSGGSKQSLDLYSHLENDTIIASPNSTFQIFRGAQMQMLVGVIRK